MIREIAQEEFSVFFELMGEVEYSRFDASNPQHVEWLTKEIDRLYYRGAKFFGYFTEEQIPVGFVTILIEDRPDGISEGYDSCQLMEIGVKKEFRQGGYGSILLNHAVQYAREQNVYCMYLHTYAGDYDVIAFYGKNGFIPVAMVPDIYGPEFEGMLFLRKVLR